MLNKNKLLASSLLFSGLPDEHIRKISEITVSKTYRKGEAIFFDGDPGIGFYMVATGKVKISRPPLTARSRSCTSSGRVSPLARCPVFHGNPFPANAETLSESVVLFFPRREFVDLITVQPSLALNMLAVLALRLRRFTTQVENLSSRRSPVDWPRTSST